MLIYCFVFSYDTHISEKVHNHRVYIGPSQFLEYFYKLQFNISKRKFLLMYKTVLSV